MSIARVALHRTGRRLLRAAGLAGVLVLPVFGGGVALLTWAEWDYLHDLGWRVLHAHGVNYPSSLARGPLGPLQSFGFAVLGVLVGAFARGLRTQFVSRRAGIAAVGGLTAAALGGLVSAFPTDLPGEPTSWHGVLHALGFLGLMGGNLVALVSAGLALRDSSDWRGYWQYSVASAAVVVLASVALVPLDQAAFYVMLVVLLAWYAVIGSRLYRLAA